jgi:hypothetical protein
LIYQVADQRDQPKGGVAWPKGGPGTELTRLVKRADTLLAPARLVARVGASHGLLSGGWKDALSLKGGTGCACGTRADQMDALGVKGCREHFDTIVGWLAESAEGKAVPDVDENARKIVAKAILRAERAGVK